MLEPITKHFSIILASASPRRKAFLDGLHIPHKVIKPHIDETRKAGEKVESYLRRIAFAKADKALQILKREAPVKNTIIISCDTVVILKDKIFGKPSSKKEAKLMLRALSGKTHKVVSCLCLIKISNNKHIANHKIVSTKVTFKKLSKAEIDYYLSLGEYRDKAGAYAAQGIGSFMIKKIDGSFTNVVGLPLSEMLELMMHIVRPKIAFKA